LIVVDNNKDWSKGSKAFVNQNLDLAQARNNLLGLLADL
jgi:hypothetical protein